MRNDKRLSHLFALGLAAFGFTGCTGKIGGAPPSDNLVPPTRSGLAAPGDQAPATAIPRLSRREIEASIVSVFGISGVADRILPADPTQATNPATSGSEEIFDTFIGTLGEYVPGGVFVEASEALAFEVAREVAADPAKLERLAGCDSNDDACLETLTRRVGLRLFRRPLRSDETARLLDAATAFDDFPLKARSVIQSLVMSVDFLYRVDLGGAPDGDGLRALNNYEMLSRLSYLFWGAPPTDAMLARAVGPLFDEEEFAALVDEAAADSRTTTQVRNLHTMWIGYEELLVSDPEIRRAMLEESDALLDRVLEGSVAWSTLFTSQTTFLSPELAAHYGMEGEGWTDYTNPERAGILSHGSFLSLSSTQGAGTLPSRRGAVIAARFLCSPVPPPPANVDIDDGVEVAEGECKADGYAAHRASPTCRGCHSIMDPIGFGFERFDGEGRYRTEERLNPECSIAGTGRAAGADFFGPRGFVEAIAASGDLTECGTEQVVRFAFRRGLQHADQALVQRLHEEFVESGEDFRALLRSVALDPTFRYRVEESP